MAGNSPQVRYCIHVDGSCIWFGKNQYSMNSPGLNKETKKPRNQETKKETKTLDEI